MNKINAVFLNAKHWQVFFVLFFAPYVSGFVYIFFPRAIYASIAVMVVYGLCTLGWYWSIGRFLASIADPALRMRTSLFQFAFVYTLVYAITFVWLALSNAEISPIIVPFHLFAMACIFYALYFVARNLALVETGKSVSFADYAVPFVLLWFFPIGVWIIQPKINRLYASKERIATQATLGQ